MIRVHLIQHTKTAEGRHSVGLFASRTQAATEITLDLDDQGLNSLLLAAVENGVDTLDLGDEEPTLVPDVDYEVARPANPDWENPDGSLNYDAIRAEWDDLESEGEPGYSPEMTATNAGLTTETVTHYECMNCGTLRTHGPEWVGCQDELGAVCRIVRPCRFCGADTDKRYCSDLCEQAGERIDRRAASHPSTALAAKD